MYFRNQINDDGFLYSQINHSLADSLQKFREINVITKNHSVNRFHERFFVWHGSNFLFFPHCNKASN